jgi:hypothetical protein
MRIIKYNYRIFLFFICVGLMLILIACSNLKTESNMHLGAREEPMLLNVTYETPMRDLDEERRFTMEHLNYYKKIKELETKFNQDIELVKMLVNLQNLQIDKLHEILNVNNSVAKRLVQKAVYNKLLDYRQQ